MKLHEVSARFWHWQAVIAEKGYKMSDPVQVVVQ
jgi:hypothetical protein